MGHDSNPNSKDALIGGNLTAAKRLEAHIAANEVIVFEHGFPDREFPYILCSMWGVTTTNEIYVRLTNGKISFIDRIRSPIEVPLMEDRRFGMDVAEAHVAGELAEQIWEKHKHELILKSNG